MRCRAQACCCGAEGRPGWLRTRGSGVGDAGGCGCVLCQVAGHVLCQADQHWEEKLSRDQAGGAGPRPCTCCAQTRTRTQRGMGNREVRADLQKHILTSCQVAFMFVICVVCTFFGSRVKDRCKLDKEVQGRRHEPHSNCHYATLCDPGAPPSPVGGGASPAAGRCSLPTVAKVPKVASALRRESMRLPSDRTWCGTRALHLATGRLAGRHAAAEEVKKEVDG